MKVNVEFTGTSEVIAKLAKLTSPEAESKRTRALFKQGLVTMTKAKNYTPVLTGALRSTGTVTIEGGSIVLKFGGPLAPYAIYVHEDLTAHHPIGQAKFLERAMIEDTPAFIKAANTLE